MGSDRFLWRCFRPATLLFLLGIIIEPMLMVGGSFRSSPKKTYFTNKNLLNKAFQDEYKEFKLDNVEDCQENCDTRSACFAFSFSSFAEICLLFREEPGMKVIQVFSYTLYVSEKKESDGYFKFGSNYIKIFLQRASAYNAQKTCEANSNGKLVAIKSEALNTLVWNIMDSHKVFEAHIGLTDEIDEQNWLYYDGAPLKYENWYYNGKWFRRDMNCATMIANMQWRHVNCHDEFYFICQIPFY